MRYIEIVVCCHATCRNYNSYCLCHVILDGHYLVDGRNCGILLHDLQRLLGLIGYVEIIV